MTRTEVWVGVDPGVNTGFAVWNSVLKGFTNLHSSSAVKAENDILYLHRIHQDRLRVVVEDSRGNYVPPAMRKPQQIKGVGSVHRDCSRWEEFLTYHKIPFTMAKLSKNPLRKSTAADFKRITGYEGSTNEHGRDAGAMVFGR